MKSSRDDILQAVKRGSGLMTKRLVAAVMAGSLIVSGCASGGAGGGPLAYTAEENALRQSQEKFVLTVATGAGVGALAGGIIGGIIGNRKGALIGAAAGALIGGAAGTYIASMQNEYASEEARIDAMTADVRMDNENLVAYLDTTRQIVANDRARLAELDAQYAAKTLDANAARSQIGRIRENQELIASSVKNLREKRDAYREAAQVTARDTSEQEVAQLNREIAQLEANIAKLETELSSLDAALEVSEVA